MIEANGGMGADFDVAASEGPPQESDCAPTELPSGEVRSSRYSICAAPGAHIDIEVQPIAEFWLNVADGDALWALALACERMSQIADRESFGFRRGKSPATPTGLPNDEHLVWARNQ